ncbi:MAG: SDR family oxidoreductase [Rhodospirillales bacterium]
MDLAEPTGRAAALHSLGPACFLDLSGRTALVTGAGQGIGAGIAAVLGSFGAKVLVNDFHQARAELVAGAIIEAGGEAEVCAFDVGDYALVHQAISGLRIDLLINNAGNAGAQMELADWQPFWQTGPDEWRHWLDVNLYGVLNCTRVALPGMIERQFGRIVTIVSDAGRVGDPRYAIYSAAKAGAAGFVRSIARSTGRHGITANCISLGGVATEGARSILKDDEAIRRMLNFYIIRRVGQPADAAYMTLFLCAEAGSWITGQTYPVNGGFDFAT